LVACIATLGNRFPGEFRNLARRVHYPGTMKHADLPEIKALRAARKILKDGPVVLYQFPNGKWSWAAKGSPIHSQLVATGEIYQTVPAVKWFTVGNNVHTF